MHPEIARQMIAQRHKEIAAMAAGRPSSSGRIGPAPIRLRKPARILPFWRISWSRVATPADAAGGRAWMIVISTRRAIRPAA